MDAWDRLLRIAPPPASPRHASGDWSMAERVIGASFPPDYRRLVGTYGLGTFGELVYLRSPLAPDDCCHPLRTETGIVWATSVNDDRLAWRPGKEPGAWDV